MAFRGRGRGRGGGWGRGNLDSRHGTPVPYAMFPEDVELPDIPTITMEDRSLIRRRLLLESFWKTSCYYLVDVVHGQSNNDIDIQRYSDTTKKKTQKRESLSSYIKLTSSNFPAELIQGTKVLQHTQKKLRWDKDADITFKRLSMLEEREEKSGNGADKGKNNDEDDDDEPEEEVVEDESSDDGDYAQNFDFDDDDDDMNMEEEPDEDTYE